MKQFISGTTSISSGNKAATTATATFTHTGNNLFYVTGIECTASGATTALPVIVTLAGCLGGTMSWIFTFPAGVLIAAQPLIIEFNPPLPSVDANTDVVLTLPSSGTGGTNAAVVLHGFVGARNLLD
jgi:hypothetical protein